jgi:RES domain
VSSLDEARPSGPLYRLARRPDPWAWPDWAYAGEDGTFGNRYDDPESEFRVLYASSDRLTCFLETLARFRPDPHVAAIEIASDPRDAEFPTLPPGHVPAKWTTLRAIGSVTVDWVFADIGTRRSLGHQLVRHGVDDLDGAAIRASVPRAFTQEVSRYVYEHADVAGLRYLSRLGDDGENWTIHEPAVIPARRVVDVEPDDPDLRAALELFGLTLVFA